MGMGGGERVGEMRSEKRVEALRKEARKGRIVK